jgi:hypothetical protein
MRTALFEFQLGNFSRSIELFDEIKSKLGASPDLTFYRRRALDRVKPKAAKSTAILWRGNNEWESDWLSRILPGLPTVDPNRPVEEAAGRTVVVIDNFIAGGRADFYRRAYEAGCRIVLFHLSDERFKDDHSIYRWCHTVFRNYYSPILQRQTNVFFFALGYKSGFAVDKPHVPIESRRYSWSFAGDPNKSTRLAMLTAMRSLGGGIEHLTSNFASPDALDISRYREMMSRSLFVPCPMGWVNLDSFRVYEALEAGCIPIVERRSEFDYFTEAFGPCPFPSVRSWNEAVGIVNDIRQRQLTEQLLLECHLWWTKYKSDLKSLVDARIRDCQSPRPTFIKPPAPDPQP